MPACPIFCVNPHYWVIHSIRWLPCQARYPFLRIISILLLYQKWTSARRRKRDNPLTNLTFPLRQLLQYVIFLSIWLTASINPEGRARTKKNKDPSPWLLHCFCHKCCVTYIGENVALTRGNFTISFDRSIPTRKKIHPSTTPPHLAPILFCFVNKLCRQRRQHKNVT